MKIRKAVENNGIGVAADAYFAWHVNEYKTYWNKCYVEIGDNRDRDNGDRPQTTVETPVPDLLKAAGSDNVELVNKYINFGRYLLIAGSRCPGKLPATLQGLWNCYMDPPWGSKYTININTEMNYWPVNMAGLSECELPLFELLEIRTS